MSLVFLALKLDIVLVLLFQLDFYFPMATGTEAPVICRAVESVDFRAAS
jgi:hypothetical protein